MKLKNIVTLKLLAIVLLNLWPIASFGMTASMNRTAYQAAIKAGEWARILATVQANPPDVGSLRVLGSQLGVSNSQPAIEAALQAKISSSASTPAAASPAPTAPTPVSAAPAPIPTPTAVPAAPVPPVSIPVAPPAPMAPKVPVAPGGIPRAPGAAPAATSSAGAAIYFEDLSAPDQKKLIDAEMKLLSDAGVSGMKLSKDGQVNARAKALADGLITTIDKRPKGTTPAPAPTPAVAGIETFEQMEKTIGVTSLPWVDGALLNVLQDPNVKPRIKLLVDAKLVDFLKLALGVEKVRGVDQLKTAFMKALVENRFSPQGFVQYAASFARVYDERKDSYNMTTIVQAVQNNPAYKAAPGRQVVLPETTAYVMEEPVVAAPPAASPSPTTGKDAIDAEKAALMAAGAAAEKEILEIMKVIKKNAEKEAEEKAEKDYDIDEDVETQSLMTKKLNEIVAGGQRLRDNLKHKIDQHKAYFGASLLGALRRANEYAWYREAAPAAPAPSVTPPASAAPAPSVTPPPAAPAASAPVSPASGSVAGSPDGSGPVPMASAAPAGVPAPSATPAPAAASATSGGGSGGSASVTADILTQAEKDEIAALKGIKLTQARAATTSQLNAESKKPRNRDEQLIAKLTEKLRLISEKSGL